MTKKKTRHIFETYYVSICKTCGKEYEVTRRDDDEYCCECLFEVAKTKAKEGMAFFIGAEVLEITPTSPTAIDEIESIKVKCKSGQLIEFTADVYEERYIAWVELES